MLTSSPQPIDHQELTVDGPPVVLVADDDQDIGVLLQAVLSDEGCDR